MIAPLLAALTITSAPPRVQLGETARARLRIVSRGEPRLAASVGRIENLRREGGERWAADYVPPDDSVPQIAVISAISGAEVGVLALPLWGHGDAVVKTRPGARIEVQIGQERFPAIADATGTAVVPVNVPPGVRAAKHGKQSIDLHVPPSRKLHVALERERVTADRDERVQVLLFAVVPDGAPRSDARFTLKVSRGQVSEPRRRAAGVYEAEWKVPAGPSGRASLAAELTDAPGRAEAALEVVGGQVAKLRLSADRERLVAGDSEFTARVVALDSAGNLSPEPLRFDTTLGVVRGEGPEVRVEVPASFGGRTELRLSARPLSRGEPLAELALPLVPGEAQVAELELPGAHVHADGVSPFSVRLRLLDRFGNPVPGARPVATAERGSIAELAPAGGGTYVATYVPPLSRERTDAVLVVQAGAAQARGRIELLPHIRPLALSPRLGALTNFSGFTAPVVGFETALRSDFLGPQLGLSLDLSYSLQNAGGSGAGISARSHTDWITVAPGVAWRAPLAPGIAVWVGAGPQLTTVLTRTQFAGMPTQTGVALLPGAYLSAGAEKRFGSALPFVELRASITKDPALPNLRGALRALALTLGYRFEML